MKTAIKKTMKNFPAKALLCVLAVFLLLPLFTRPGIFFLPFRLEFMLFSQAVFSTVAFILILAGLGRLSASFAKNPLVPSIPLAVIFALSMYHFLSDDSYLFEHLAASLLFISVPTVSWMYYREIRRILPGVIFIYSTAGVIVAVSQIFLPDRIEFCGITGNRNWSAALLLFTTPFAVMFLRKIMPGIPGMIAAIPAVIISAYLFIRFDSRASFISLAVILVCTAFAWLSVKAVKSALIKNILKLSAIAGIAVSVLFFFSFGTKIFSEDIRADIWGDAIQLFLCSPFTGTGQPSFESEFEPFRSIGYFLDRNAAVRTNHPHSDLIFIACSLGIFGLVAWGLLLIYPVILMFMKLRFEHDTFMKAMLVMFAGAVIHANLDLVFFELPTSFLFFAVLGTIWARVWPPSKCAMAVHELSFRICARVFIVILSLIAASSFILGATASLISSRLLESNVPNREDASCIADSVALYKADPTIIYRAVTRSLLHLGSPEATLYYLDILDGTPAKNFAHNHAYRARSLAMQGRFSEAVRSQILETINYPLSVSALLFLRDLQLRTGDIRGAEETAAAVVQALKLKGLAPEDVPLLMKNPEYDLKPYLLKEKKNLDEAKK